MNMAEINHIIDDPTDYKQAEEDLTKTRVSLLDSCSRFEDVKDRKNTGTFTFKTMMDLCKGKYVAVWRGVTLLKDALDVFLYEQLMWELKPKTIFESGTYTGGCALWMADTMRSFGESVPVITVDITDMNVHELVKNDPDIKVKIADITKIDEAFPEEMLQKCEHPWLLTEDCHVDLLGVLEHFHKYMKPGDYFIIDDTGPNCPLVSGQGLLDNVDINQENGMQKLLLLNSFLEKYSDYYKIDTFYTDRFGYNASFNWNGYIKRVK